MSVKLDWYIFQLNTAENFSSFQKLITSIVPKGCSVFALSNVKHNPYWTSKLDRKMVLTNYIFVLCNLKYHGSKIIKALRSFEVEAEVLKGMDGKPVKLSDEEIEHMISLSKGFENIEFVDSTFSLGDKIKVMSGPMSGFEGNISLITAEYIYCPIKIMNKLANIPFLREDIVKLKR